MTFSSYQYEIIAVAFAVAFFAVTTIFEDSIHFGQWPRAIQLAYGLVLLVATLSFLFGPARILVMLAVRLGSVWPGLGAALVWCVVSLPALQVIQNATRMCLRRPTRPVSWLPEPAWRAPKP